MLTGTARALRFGKGWKFGAPHVREFEVELDRSDGTSHATLFVPEGLSGPLPGWVTLHGITRPGRKHPMLVRFVRALSASGAVVLVPEIPEWREMLLAPREAADTLRAAILALAEREETKSDHLGVMGFSFGGPQALMAGMDPALVPNLKAVASFGGYCDMERTLRFLFSGEHEWDGIRHRAEPDPYGRWIVGGNYLSRAEGFEDAGDVAKALLDLAKAAGDLQIASWDAGLDPLKTQLEESLNPSRRELFRAFAPATGTGIPSEFVERLVPVLTAAAQRDSPLFDIAPHLSKLKAPALLIHGHQDRLIPFTETLRLAECLDSASEIRVFFTGLFSHSQRNSKKNRIGDVREQLRFLRIMSAILGTL